MIHVELGLWCAEVKNPVNENHFEVGSFVIFRRCMTNDLDTPHAFYNKDEVGYDHFLRSQLKDIKKLDYQNFFKEF